MKAFMREVAKIAVFFAIVGVALLATGCGATSTKTVAGYLEGRADEVRQSDDARAGARREATKRIHCRTTLTDFYAMPKQARTAYAQYCGYE